MAKQEKGSSGTKQLIIGLLGVTIIGLGAGFGLSKMLPAPPPAAPKAPVAEAAPEKPAEKPAAKPGEASAEAIPASAMPPPSEFSAADLSDAVLTPFVPITTNIAVPETVWIRLEGALAIKPNGAVKPADIATLAASQLVPYMRTLKLADLQGPSGYLALNEDLNHIVRSATDGQARAVLISGFIVE